MKIEIKNRFNGSVLFAHDVEENSLAITLRMAIKSRANLSRANLSDADLSGADLSGANLSRADLSGADLSGADLYGADLYGANLSGANLSGADLYGANLSRADLYGADLYGANLSGANLSGADLYGANLSRANLSDAKESGLVIAKTRILPDEGDIVGWKKCQCDVIVKLLIKSETKRCHAFGRKCRAERATVLEIFGADKAISSHDGKTEYIKGQDVICDLWGEDWTKESSGGIHFFITRLEAENY